MNYQKFLLPHFMQFVGAALFICGLVAICLIKLDAMLFVSYIFLSVGLLLVAVSKERTEDEYITYLRMRSIITVALLCLIYTIVSPLVDLVLIKTMGVTALGRVKMVQNMLTSAPVIVMLYLLLFKVAVTTKISPDE